MKSPHAVFRGANTDTLHVVFPRCLMAITWKRCERPDVKKNNYQLSIIIKHKAAKHPQALTQVSRKVRERTVDIWLRGLRSYTTHTKTPLRLRCLRKHGNRSSLGSSAQHRTRCTKTEASKQHKEAHLCQSIARALRGRPVTDTSPLRSLAEGDLFHSQSTILTNIIWYEGLIRWAVCNGIKVGAQRGSSFVWNF